MAKKAKTIFLGDSGVGKSCIISTICGFPINNTHKVIYDVRSANGGDGFLDENIQGEEGLIQDSAMGYGWTVEISQYNFLLHSKF